MSTARVFRLTPWVVRALLPAGFIGTYVLYRRGAAHYVGRSDTCVQRRLLQHCASSRGEYFTYDVHSFPGQAFTVECSLFHALRHQLTNIIHPDRPNFSRAKCPFCWSTLHATRQHRLSIPAHRKPSAQKGTL